MGRLVGALVRETEYTGREIHVDVESVVVPADAPKLERMVENLLMNAIRHTPHDAGVWSACTPRTAGP